MSKGRQVGTSRRKTRFDGRTKEELVRELEKLRTAARRLEATADEPDRERLVHDLQVHQVELEMETRELREAQERLEDATSRFADLYDFAPVGYCTLDLKGRIREINLTAAAIIGAARENLVGRVFSSVAPLENKRSFLTHMQRCVERDARVTTEIVLARGARGTRTLQLVSDPVHPEHGATTTFRTILVDISELKGLENRLRLLVDAGERLGSSLDYSAVLETISRTVVPAVADLCMIDVMSESGSIERPVVLFADPGKQKRLAERLRHLAARPGWQTAQSRVISSGESLLLEESAERRRRVSEEDRQFDPTWAAGVGSLMVVPLAARGRTIGALTLAAAESERRFTAADLRLAQDLANRAAMAVDNSRLYDQGQRAMGLMRVAEAKASGIVAISADAIISVDERYRITLWNAGAEKIYGYSRAEAIGAPLEMLVPERLRGEHGRDMARFTAGSEIARKMGDRRGAIVGLRKDSEEFPADATISKLRVGDQQIFTVAVRDVTEQRRIEGEQRFLAELGQVLASNLDYQDTLTHVTRLVARDLADFSVLYLDDDRRQLRRASAASRDAAKSWFSDLLLGIPVDARPGHVARQVIATRKPILGEVTPDMLPSLAEDEDHLSALRELDLRSWMGVPLVAGDTCFGALLFESSTRLYGPPDLQLAEEIGRRTALLIENARLHRAARVAIQARDDVLRIVAHDLRNPLVSILLEVGVLRAAGGKESADVIHRGVVRMKRLIDDLLDAVRLESGALAIDRSNVSVASIVSEFAGIHERLSASRSLELRIELASDLGDVYADRDRLLQVLENLVTNAEKFTAPGGRITIGAAPSEGAVAFWVADTGPGIESRDLPYIFDRYSRRQTSDRRGTGLGLPIVKGIVEAHGGRVWAESRAGAGSTFFFTMPRAATHPSARPVTMPRYVDDRESARM